MSEQDDSGVWQCPNCDEKWGDLDAKVPGGCLQCVDMLRYIEHEVPDAGMVHNDVAALVCASNHCDETIDVDPATLVAEDHDAVSLESEEFDMETGETTGFTRLELYCSAECRNDHFDRQAPDQEVDIDV